MVRATLNDAINFLKGIDIWHEFKFSEQQVMTVAPELQKYGLKVLNEALLLSANSATCVAKSAAPFPPSDQ